MLIIESSKYIKNVYFTDLFISNPILCGDFMGWINELNNQFIPGIIETIGIPFTYYEVNENYAQKLTINDLVKYDFGYRTVWYFSKEEQDNLKPHVNNRM